MSSPSSQNKPSPPPPYSPSDWISFLSKHPEVKLLNNNHTDVLSLFSSKSPTECFDTLSSDKFLSVLVQAPPPGKEFAILHSFFKVGGNIRNKTIRYYALQGTGETASPVELDPVQVFKSITLNLPTDRNLTSFNPKSGSIESIQGSQKNSTIPNAIPLPPFLLSALNKVDPTEFHQALQHMQNKFDSIDKEKKSNPNSNIQPSTQSKVLILQFIWALLSDKLEPAHYRPATRPTAELESQVSIIHKTNLTGKKSSSFATPSKTPIPSSSSSSSTPSALSPNSTILNSMNKNLTHLVQNSALLHKASNKSPTEKIKARISSIAYQQILLASQPNATTTVQDPCPTMVEFLNQKSESAARLYINQVLVSRTQASIFIPRGTVTALYNGSFTWDSATEVKNFTLFAFPPYEEGIEMLSKEKAQDRVLAIKRTHGSEELSTADIQNLTKQSFFIPHSVEALIQHISNGALVLQFLFGKTSFIVISIYNCLSKVKANRITFIQYHHQDKFFLSKFLHALDRKIYNFLLGCECGSFLQDTLLFSQTIESVTQHSNFNGTIPYCLHKKRTTPEKEKDHKGKDEEKQNEGKKVKNSNKVDKWIHPEHKEYGKLHKNLSECPKVADEMICARWHCKGECYTDCRRKSTHKKLDPESDIGKKFTKWIEDSLSKN